MLTLVFTKQLWCPSPSFLCGIPAPSARSWACGPPAPRNKPCLNCSEPAGYSGTSLVIQGCHLTAGRRVTSHRREALPSLTPSGCPLRVCHEALAPSGKP